MAVNDLSKVFGIPSPTETLDLTPQFQTSPETGTLGLEQPSTLTKVGSRLSNNLARMGGYDPMQLSNAEERRQARMAGLRELSYRLSQTAAKLSGDPARMQIAQQQEAQRIEARQDQFKKRQQEQFIQDNPQLKGAIELNQLFPGVNLPTVKSTEAERFTERLVELNNKPTLNDREKTELNILKSKLYGPQEIVPFLDSDGNPINQIVTNWDINDNPGLLKELNNQGFVTVGSGQGFGFKAPTTPSEEISDKWEGFTNEINLINDLGKLIVEGEDSITFAGKVADTLNSGIYQYKSAARLLNFQKNDPKGYTETVNKIQKEYGNVLDKISSDRGIGASLVMQLAYGLAKNVDPNARLTDRDIEAAIQMLGGTGGNAKKRLATFNSLVKTRTREYETFLDKKRKVYGNNKAVNSSILQFKTLPKFEYYSEPDSAQTADEIIKELEQNELL